MVVANYIWIRKYKFIRKFEEIQRNTAYYKSLYKKIETLNCDWNFDSYTRIGDDMMWRKEFAITWSTADERAVLESS